MKVLITGVSSGIGLGLARAYLEEGATVFGLSRREPPADVLKAIQFRSADLSDFESVASHVDALLTETKSLDTVWLNAGVLGKIQDMAEASIESMQVTFDINVWSNKALLDALYGRGIQIDEVIAMSSGAAVNGNRGWNGYSISKAALNMLVQLYAAERPDTHFSSLAPGLVDTAMQDYICGLSKDDKRPSVERLKAARGTSNMPLPDEAAKRILAALPILRKLPSGSFQDIRNLPES